MNRTFGSDLHQFRVLFCGQRPGEFHFHIDSVEHAFLGFALLAISCVNARVPQRNGDVFQRQFIPARVKADGHCGANTEGRQQIIVRIWPSIVAPDAYWFIRDEVMFTNSDFLLKIVGAAAHDDMSCLFVALCGHHRIKR